mmetsp:Transcript_36938/g.61225  ORF Transcript_36938/g.61225 Transcript_36938/m.61225 type:complete len:648 (-) Transcript_36938:329-2272(-)
MWSCFLSGSYVRYGEDANSTIEESFQRGDAAVRITVKGTAYDIHFGEMKQRQASQPGRQRGVKRDHAQPPPVARTPSTPPAPATGPMPKKARPEKPMTAAPAGAQKQLDTTQKGRASNKDPKMTVAESRPTSGAAVSQAVAAAEMGSSSVVAGSSSVPAVAESCSSTASGGHANQAIIDMLTDLADDERVKGDKMKMGVYYKAANAVKAFKEKITSGKHAKQQLKGVGGKIADKIDELIATGSLSRLEREKQSERTRALRELQRVHGIGHKKAEDLFTAHGITDLYQLSARSELLTAEQATGLKYVSEFEERISRAEIANLERGIRAAAERHSPPLSVVVCGSYRRGAPSSGDVDVLLSHKSYSSNASPEPLWLKSLVELLQADGIITDLLSLGNKKCSAVCLAPPLEVVTPCQATSRTSRGDSDSACAAGGDGSHAGGNGEGSQVISSPDCGQPSSLRLPSWQDVAAARRQKASGQGRADLFAALMSSSAQTRVAVVTKGTKPSAAPADTRAEGSSSGESIGGSTGGALMADAWADTVAAPQSFDTASEELGSAFQLRLHRRIDLRLVPIDSFHTSTLYFTGSGEFNKMIRARAIDLGYKLSEYSLVKTSTDEVQVITSEQDVFDALQMDYVEPTKRDWITKSSDV